MLICQITMKLRDGGELGEVGLKHFWFKNTLLFAAQCSQVFAAQSSQGFAIKSSLIQGIMI